MKRVTELKQQLAEKEKEIEVLKQRLKDTVKIYSDDFVEKDKELKELRFQARNIFPLIENLEDKVNQDKISFCVEQLEETKKLLANLDMPDSPVLYNDDMFQAGFDSHYVRTRQTIDNQIEELKKEMK